MDLRISKIDAARRQLDTAVRLYFSEADPVSIHGLTAAAHGLLGDINKVNGRAPMLTESLLQHVRPDQLIEATRVLRAAANFFKHADRDPQDIHIFNPGQTEVLLFDACFKYKELTNELVPCLGVYQAWFWLGPGAGLVDVSQTKTIDKARAAFPGATRATFFAQVLPMVSTFKL